MVQDEGVRQRQRLVTCQHCGKTGSYSEDNVRFCQFCGKWATGRPKSQRKPLTNSQKGNLVWAVFWLIIWVAFLGPIGLIPWIVGWFLWGVLWNLGKINNQRSAEEARISAGLVTCPFCHQDVHPQKTMSYQRSAGGGFLFGKGKLSGVLLGGGTLSQGFWKCPNCGMDLGRRE